METKTYVVVILPHEPDEFPAPYTVEPEVFLVKSSVNLLDVDSQTLYEFLTDDVLEDYQFDEKIKEVFVSVAGETIEWNNSFERAEIEDEPPDEERDED